MISINPSAPPGQARSLAPSSTGCAAEAGYRPAASPVATPLRPFGATRRAALVVLTVAGLLAGCQTAHVAEPLAAKLGGNDADQQMEFWHQLAERPVTSNDDAFHGLLLYLDGADPAADYAGRVQTLKDRGLLPKSFSRPADQGVERGTLAVAITKALNIKGGWAMRAFGPTPRYATRELVYLDLYPPSGPNQTFSGTEFLGIMGKFEDWQREGPDTANQPDPALLNPEKFRTSAPQAGPSPEEPVVPPGQ
jgi:hypothetical protein